jgi:DNA-binding transcriptional LysR family regulator
VRFTGLAPQSEWAFRSPQRRIAIDSVLTCNQADTAIEACAAGLGLGLFLSYMVAPLMRSGKLKYVLEDFETEPLPVQLVYPQSRMLSPNVRAFADLCAKRLRQTKLD